MSDLEKSSKNFKKALSQLDEFLQVENPRKIERAGIIQAFEFCFELAWKHFKKISDDNGLAVGSPKQALKAAFSQGLIDDQDIWLEMLVDRNLTVHSYNDELSQAIYERIRDKYQFVFHQIIKNETSKM